MALAVGKKKKMVSEHEILQLILCIDYHGLHLLSTFFAKKNSPPFLPSFRSVYALSQFLLHIFPVISH
jgi:hypothetical protein